MTDSSRTPPDDTDDSESPSPTRDRDDADGGAESGQDVLLTIAVFAIAFVLIGFLLPQIITLYAPDGHYIEIHNVTAQNTTTEAGAASIKVTKTVNRPTDGTILLELIKVSNGSSSQVAVYFGPHYFEEGTETIYYVRELPDDLKPGRYYWILHFQLDYNSAQRTVTQTSNTFVVQNTSTNETVKLKHDEKETP